MSDIFISYARSTTAEAERISKALRSLGYSVWRDDALPAHKAYGEVIEEQLSAAKAVIVIWSADAARSDWVRSEADRARNEHKLVQLSVDGAPLPMPFDQIQCADLLGWSGDTGAAGWQTVISSVAALVADETLPALNVVPEAPAASTAPAASKGVVLAVLPFDNLSTDPEMQFFSDGVSEEIIQRLSRGANLTLIGRTSSFQFRGERKAEAAGALHCSHVLDGSVRRAAGKVRISAHLVEASTHSTLWSDRYDGSLDDIFALQDDISERIAESLDQTFSSSSTKAVDPGTYDLYLRASPRTHTPDELRTNIGLLEIVTQREPDFTEAWARLAYTRAWLRFYQPFEKRGESAAMVAHEAERALAVDPQNVDALAAKFFVIAPFGQFSEAYAAVDRLREAPGWGDGQIYVGWFLRTVGHVRESLVCDERSFQTDPLHLMCANGVALARMAAGHLEEAIPVYEELVQRAPEMTFPFSSLLRAKALLGDWDGVDELLALSTERDLGEFEDGLRFIRTKRDPTPENLARWCDALDTHVARTGCVDAAQLTYTAHLGLVDEAYQAAERACLGPRGTGDDVMGPDGYRTSMLFQAKMPELRQDRRFVHLCARLGLVEFWTSTGRWPDCADEVPYDFRAECENARSVPKEPFPY